MANRLTRIYTRTGDKGETGTASGARLPKDDPLMQLQGELDELNCQLGVLAVNLTGDNLAVIRNIQHALFDIGGEISLGQPILKQKQVDALEHRIDAFNTTLQPLKEFILPGGNEAGALCHLARAVCRRTERSMVALNRNTSLNPVSLAYVNRLSDLLFVFARILNDSDEIYWKSEKNK
jgi:cob(I)alamin adenosyltransferase